MPRARISRELLDQILGLRMTSYSQKYKRPTMPFALAITVAERKGWIVPGQVSVSTLAAYARELALDRRSYRKPQPALESGSLRPLEAYEIDVSWCRQVYLTPKGQVGIGRYEDGTLPYNNRELEPSQRILRFVAADKASGAICGYYLPAERLEDLAFFVAWAFGPKWEPGSPEFCAYYRDGLDGLDEREQARILAGDPHYPMKGIPRWVRADRNAVNQAPTTKDLVRRLTGHPLIIVQRAWQQGSVESAHRVWEDWIESCLRLDPCESFEALNRAAYQQAAWLNATRLHTRHGRPRFEAFLDEQLVELRIPPPWPEFVQALTRFTRAAKVNHRGIVTVNRQEYRIPDTDYWSEWVEVRAALFADPEGRLEVAWPAPGKPAAKGLCPRTWLVPPIQRDRFGYELGRRRQALPVSRTVRQEALLPKPELGPVWPAAPATGERVARRGLGWRPTVVSLRGEEPAEPPRVDVIEASRRVAQAFGGEIPDEVAAERDRRWGAATSVAEPEVEALIAWGRALGMAARVRLIRR